jgi:hypothetical protein
LAVAASRSSLVGALLRTASPSERHNVVNFLRGLSCSELECLAEFEGAVALESQLTETCNGYRLVEEFFEPAKSERWLNSEARAHKTFLVLAWLENSRHTASHAAHHLSVRF